MASNSSYRIKANVGEEKSINVQLTQDYDTFEILSMKLDADETYRIHDSNYGIIVGRVLANNGFGVPNAKISVFIEADRETLNGIISSKLYPYRTTSNTNTEGIRYNLLPDKKVETCHQVVGSFPSKQFVLDNDDILEIFETYYKYTTRTNNAGDYMISNVPVGQQTLHMDLDISDCGILSQRPRDMYYQGYNEEMFENPNMFKKSTKLNSLPQIFSQDEVVNVIPFWGDFTSDARNIGITRADINIDYTFTPTCVFMGSVVSDNKSNGVSERCIPTENMGAMDELVAGEGTIEMIRKTPTGDVEEFQIKGNELINADGVWCYQIPMNLDYVMTDEYGNMVPTNDPSKGIPTRARVRFRISLQDFDGAVSNFYLPKVLVPHNPEIITVTPSSGKTEYKLDEDYNFGTYTKDNSYRDLFWNNVYTVKSYIPRFQKSQYLNNTRFSGIKHCNIYGANNPIPYNNIRIKLPLMFTIMCAIIKMFIRVVTVYNRYGVSTWFGKEYMTLSDNLCPDLENWYFAPGGKDETVLKRTLDRIIKAGDSGATETDSESIDSQNQGDQSYCLTTNIDYLVACIEMNLAQEYKVINFDFYNDWINGMIYIPRWKSTTTKRKKKRRRLFGKKKTVTYKVWGCMGNYNDNIGIFNRYSRIVQQCSLSYELRGDNTPTNSNSAGCDSKGKQKCHTKKGWKEWVIFGAKGGLVQEIENLKGQYVYYLKPSEATGSDNNKKANLFATDIVLLGSLNSDDKNGIPQAFTHLDSSSYKMPTNLALTNMDSSGYLYSNAGTICATSSGGTIVNKITRTGNSFSAEKAFNSNKDSDNGVAFEEMDEFMPLTEAAGIAWNYSGPGQGEALYDGASRMIYQPGGHFLGISCTNSATNIKSCINLERICEAGVNMSQRKEVVTSVDSATTKDKTYRFFVPTGFIGKDEIADDDFRTMFATMNMKKLIANADTADPQTGYPMYDFMYVRPSNFNGDFSNVVTATTSSDITLYNKSMSAETVYEPSIVSGSTIDDSVLKDAKKNTYTRTIETPSTEYYKFRMGLDNLSLAEQEKKYLIKTNSNDYYLPQRENSYYFYFGIKEGATALDELNRQYFSECNDEPAMSDTRETLPQSPYFEIKTTPPGGRIDRYEALRGTYDHGSWYSITAETINEIFTVNKEVSVTLGVDVDDVYYTGYTFDLINDIGSYNRLPINDKDGNSGYTLNCSCHSIDGDKKCEFKLFLGYGRPLSYDAFFNSWFNEGYTNITFRLTVTYTSRSDETGEVLTKEQALIWNVPTNATPLFEITYDPEDGKSTSLYQTITVNTTHNNVVFDGRDSHIALEVTAQLIDEESGTEDNTLLYRNDAFELPIGSGPRTFTIPRPSEEFESCLAQAVSWPTNPITITSSGNTDSENFSFDFQPFEELGYLESALRQCGYNNLKFEIRTTNNVRIKGQNQTQYGTLTWNEHIQTGQ